MSLPTRSTRSKRPPVERAREIGAGEHRHRLRCLKKARRDEPHDARDQVRFEQPAPQRRTAFTQNAAQVAFAQRPQRRGEIERARSGRPDVHDVRDRLERRETFANPRRSQHDRRRVRTGRGVGRGGEHAAVRRHGVVFAHDDAHVRFAPGAVRADRQLRVVGANRARSDHHRVVLIAQTANKLARGRARHGVVAAGAGSDRAVERHRHLERDERDRVRGCEGEALDERTRRRIVDDVDRDACRAQTSGTAARDRVGIERAGDDARDAGSEDRLRARPGPAVMVARLERDVQGCAANVGTAGARGKQGFDFRVRLAAAMVIALAQRSAITDDDRTDRRIRRCVGDRTRREFIARAR